MTSRWFYEVGIETVLLFTCVSTLKTQKSSYLILESSKVIDLGHERDHRHATPHHFLCSIAEEVLFLL